MTDKPWNGAKKLLSQRRAGAGLNLTRDVSHCSAFNPLQCRRDNIDKKKTLDIPAAASPPVDFHFEQSIVFHAALPISVIAKCLVIDAPYEVL